MGWWPLAFICLLPFLATLREQPARRGAVLGFAFGLGLFGAALSWILLFGGLAWSATYVPGIDRAMGWASLLRIHLNLAFYLTVSALLMLLWLFVIVVILAATDYVRDVLLNQTSR